MDPLVRGVADFLDIDGRVRILDANAADGARLVELAEHLADRPAYRDHPQTARVVLDSLYGASISDEGARRALAWWAQARGEEAAIVRFATGEPLSSPAEPVQGLLFEPTLVSRPPATFDSAPFDVVLADVPRLELDARERERWRGRYVSAIGRFTGEAPFVERVMGLAAFGGLVVLRMRMAVLRRDFGRALVEEVLSHAEILSVRLEEGMVTVVLRRRVAPDVSSIALLRALGEVGSAEILKRIEEPGVRLSDIVDGEIGSTSTPGCDEVWMLPEHVRDLPAMPMVRGEDVSNLRLAQVRRVLWPYDGEGRALAVPDRRSLQWLSRFRHHLEERRYFGRTLEERGLRWFDYLDHHPERWASTPTIVVARASSFVRAALVRRPVVVAANALAFTAKDEDRAALALGSLSSSVGAFWMKHAFHVHGSGAHTAFEATAQGLEEFPLPNAHRSAIIEITQRCDRLARSIHDPDVAIEGEPSRLDERLNALHFANARALRQLRFWQEELDWATYRGYGLVDAFTPRMWSESWDGERAFECDADLGDATLTERMRIIERDGLLAVLESAEYKREPEEDDWLQREHGALRGWIARRVHRAFEHHELPRDRPVSAAQLRPLLEIDALAAAVERRLGESVEEVVHAHSVPWELVKLYSSSGLRKLERNIAGEPVTFAPEDYAASATGYPRASASANRRRAWSLRGRYDVPGELFVHLTDFSELMERPLFGWALANEEERERLIELVAAEEDAPQLDLERIMSLTAVIRDAPELTTSEIAQKMWAQGWSYRDVRAILAVLAATGAIVEEAGRWVVA